MIRSLRIATLAVLIGGLGSTSAAWAHSPTKSVHYHGLSLRVPQTWPVFNLSAHPSVCVRFNRHAVYLGVPGADQRCPAHSVGRTDAILVSPPARAGAASAAARSATAASVLPGSDQPALAHLRLHGLQVTATWAHDETTVAAALGVRHLRSSRAPRSAAPTTPTAPAARAARAPLAHAASVGTGLGFDPCATPSASAMSAWKASPYRFVGVYLGGANMACSQPNLTAAWVQQETSAGWHFIPTYVGLQAPTNSCGCASIQPGQATAEGTAAANDAINRAKAVAIGPGNPIYFDMEAYTQGSPATTLVRNFLSAWTSTLHAAGYVSGVYSSAASGISDLVAAYGTSYTEPDDLWIADWNGTHSTSDPYVPSVDWALHQRLHQYNGGQDVTYGGVTMNIDGDYLDGAVAGYGTGNSAPLFPDGAVLQDNTSLSIYRVAGGAPLYVSDVTVIGGPQSTTSVTPQQLAAMSAFPANGTFLVTNTGRIFRVAGGAPIAVSSWDVFGGVQPSVLIDEWDIDNIANPAAHLRAAPADGTLVEGLPSATYWAFTNGGRYPVTASSQAIAVDDSGLAAFPIVATPSGGGGLGPPACVVPGLRHKTLSQAKRALGLAHCRLGKVRRPRRIRAHHTLRVSAQSPQANAKRSANYRVGLTLR